MTKESSAEIRKDSDLRWGVERRLAFIEASLFWLGEINRANVVERFDVSMSQASADIARYLALNPDGVDYDRSAKRYTADATFQPVLDEPDANRFLGELRLIDAGLMDAAQTTLGSAPPFDATPVPQRRIDAKILRTVLMAIRRHVSVETQYQSMSRTGRAPRLIEPHALAFDGYRWHARSFDTETGSFRDFVLGRMSRARLGPPARSNPQDDSDWHSFVDLQIAPHPELSPAQKAAIALDYGIARESLKIPVRRAMLFYALKRLGLDDEKGTRPPNVQQIVLINRSDLAKIPSGQQQE